MSNYKNREKIKLNNKNLRNGVAILFLLGATLTPAEAKRIKCEREDGGTPGIYQIMKRQDIVSQDTKDLLKGKAIGYVIAGKVPEKKSILQETWFFIKRLYREVRGKNRLEIQNDNPQPITVSLEDQNSKSVTKVGTIDGGSKKKFSLDRDTLYDSYVVKGDLEGSLSSTSPTLSYRTFCHKIVFTNDTLGTTATLTKAANAY